MESYSATEVKLNGNSGELPDHLYELYDDGCKELSHEEAMKFKEFLIERKDSFAVPGKKMERATIGEHVIKLSDETPFKEPSRRIPIFKRDTLDNEIEKLNKMFFIKKRCLPPPSKLL
ncbi:hypothetical protein FSP39_024555 [Pinctada imbricata]|uniref:Uncharacterized protein n=1 Tax=Pinctada imbricata TaxID=66713 RepID=A0AA89CBN3_PINIB|nr:hypothetical protein FSP39_024555 [Pinctada imbricata]